VARIAAYFKMPELSVRSVVSDAFEKAQSIDASFAAWGERNVTPHRVPGYAIATISLKSIGAVPGDCSAEQMEAIADLSERYGAGEIRVSHEQNLVLPHVALDDLPTVFATLQRI